MSEILRPFAQWCVGLTEFIGILIITGFALYVLVHAAWSLIKRVESGEILETVRQRFGRGILLGLEFFVAADIIETVAVDLSLETVSTLGLIVLIRTFLSFMLEVELTGRWPWQQAKDRASD